METRSIYEGEAPKSWADARMVGIGGSDAGAVLGLNPYCSAYTLWMRKAGLIEPPERTERMAWGHRLEDVIAEYFRQESGFQVWDTCGYEGTEHTTREAYDDGVLFRNRERPWQLASVDRLVYDDNSGRLGVLEIKSVGAHMRDKWKDGPPPYVRAQNLHYQSVLGVTWGVVAVLFGGNSPGWIDVEPEEGELERLVGAESAFWDSLVRNEPPEADPSESTRDALAEMYPDGEVGAIAKLSDDAIGWDQKFAAHKRLERIHRNKARGYETLIRAEIGSAERGILPSGVTWKTTTVEPKIVEAHTRAGYRKYTRSAAKKKR